MKQQILADPIEHLDFHQRLREKCATLERQISSGVYTPSPSRRILVEKSRGLCRQIVVPSVNDAIVLQRLSDALYKDIKGKEPTNRAFFEPDDHAFSRPKDVLFARPEYGNFKAWLDFQTQLFTFTKSHNYIVVTDIANYYDGISYVHLRNIISSTINVKESFLDMLIYTLSSLLWQPDYMPHVDVGLPQINLDAPRILAHCFLYELGRYIVSTFGSDYVRFMNDIDIGVASVQEAKEVLKCVDLVLHTRQIRFNSGKTRILTNFEAVRHFCVRENRLLDILGQRVDARTKAGRSLDPERNRVTWLLRRWRCEKRFDQGNGEKVLKRLLSMASKLDAHVDEELVVECLHERPSCREATFRLVGRRPFEAASRRIITNFMKSGMICDDITFLHIAYCVVEAPANDARSARKSARELSKMMTGESFFAIYAKLWMASRFGQPATLLKYLRRTYEVWRADPWLGRIVGGLYPVFVNTPHYFEYVSLIHGSINEGASVVFYFHQDLHLSRDLLPKIWTIIAAPNKSKPLGINHAKFLMLLSTLRNPDVGEVEKRRLIANHKTAWRDAVYRAKAREAVHPAKLRRLIA